MTQFLIVAAGGALGAALRHGAGQISLRHLPASWPWSTFSVNILGSLAMGLLVGWLALKAEGAHQSTRLFLATGLLGGFTTFSAFSLEMAEMVRTGEIARALAYALLSVGLCVAAVFVGLWLSRRIFA